MATMTAQRKTTERPRRASPVPRLLRNRVDALIGENYAYMDSPVFRHKNIEQELFDFEKEPELPLTSWYQPTRDEAVDSAIAGAPTLMKGAEEHLMFLRFNFAKRKLSKLKKKIEQDGLTRE